MWRYSRRFSHAAVVLLLSPVHRYHLAICRRYIGTILLCVVAGIPYHLAMCCTKPRIPGSTYSMVVGCAAVVANMRCTKPGYSQSSSANIDGFSFGSQNLRRRKQLIQFDKSHRPTFYGYWSRKRYVMTFMGVVLELPRGVVRAHSKGASEIVLAACDKVINENDLESGVSAETPIPSSGYTCIGILGSKDNVRPEVKELLDIFGSTGITFRMVRGDNITTSKSIAKKCGMLTDDGIAINYLDFARRVWKHCS
nr:calcium-transporting ATPase 2, plasma membrane-type-like isoform X2 [Tanacetum cinerariifolium]